MVLRNFPWTNSIFALVRRITSCSTQAKKISSSSAIVLQNIIRNPHARKPACLFFHSTQPLCKEAYAMVLSHERPRVQTLSRVHAIRGWSLTGVTTSRHFVCEGEYAEKGSAGLLVRFRLFRLDMGEDFAQGKYASAWLVRSLGNILDTTISLSGAANATHMRKRRAIQTLGIPESVRWGAGYTQAPYSIQIETQFDFDLET